MESIGVIKIWIDVAEVALLGLGVEADVVLFLGVGPLALPTARPIVAPALAAHRVSVIGRVVVFARALRLVVRVLAH